MEAPTTNILEEPITTTTSTDKLPESLNALEGDWVKHADEAFHGKPVTEVALVLAGYKKIEIHNPNLDDHEGTLMRTKGSYDTADAAHDRNQATYMKKMEELITNTNVFKQPAKYLATVEVYFVK